MARFSDRFPEAQARLEALAELREPGRSIPAIIEACLKHGELSTAEAADLSAWARDPQRREEVRRAAREVRRKVASRQIEFIIPVYLTSYCQNDCLYCGYRKGNPLAERIRLGLDELGRELDLILSWGHRQIELVLSDDPELGAAPLLPYIELTRQKLERAGGGLISLCAPVYEQDDYRRLREAGLDWIVEWQETYHQPHFDRWHFLNSPKRHYESRLDLWDHTIAAGLARIGMGVLLGLYDWRFDVLTVIEHGNYLRRTYGIEPYAIGIPRLQPARGVPASQKTSRFTVSDEDYRFIVDLYHLAFPRSRLFFNTRESYRTNIALVAGGDLFTVDCDTLPGGYLRARLPGQFSTHQYPPRREVKEALEQMGFTCQYLEEERTPPEAIEPVRTSGIGANFEFAPWSEEADRLRLGLNCLECELSSLEAALPGERRAAAASLRQSIQAFQSAAIEHCRKAEARLTPDLDHASCQNLRAYHERFGIDLDKFSRQIDSYELSGDPTVLLMLGGRIVREFREHLEDEQETIPAQLRAGAGRNGL